MQRSSSIYGSSTALRGVQLKIGEKFKPPIKVTLPVGWKTRDPSILLSLSYDFSLEENVIAKIKAEREATEQHKQAEKLKEIQTKTSVTNPIFANIGGNILQPTTAATTATTNNSLNTTVENKPFNYKDFEDNTDTPFEAVELQTIDNMQALKSVLQPDVKTDSVTSTQPQGTDRLTTIPTTTLGIPVKGLNEDDPPKASQIIETTFPISSSLTQVTKPCPPESQDDPIYCEVGQDIPQNTYPFVTPKQGPVTTGIVSVSPQLNTVSYSSGNGTTDRKPSLPGAMRVLPATPAKLPPRRPTSVPNENMTPEILYSLQSDFEGPSASSIQKRPIPKPRSKLPPLRNDSETVSMSEHLYDVPPPPLPPKKIVGSNKSSSHPKSPGSKDDTHLKRFATPLPPILSPTPANTPPTNDAHATFTVEEVQFVNEIHAMGFPVGRVERAVKNLGCKQREVVEFLISMNDICNQGYSEDQVEMVLKDNYGQTKAVEFLKLIAQFKELGFQEEKIFEALKKSECDSNKALDILTCAS